MLIGQEKLKDRLLESSHQFIVLTGPKGHGKKLLTKWLAFQLNCPLYPLPELKVDAVRDMIADSLTLASKKLYLIADADDMTVQAQNALLKFCEEPSENAIIVMTVESIDSVLSTIKSRAKVFHLDPYTKEQLKNATDDELILSICENFGQIERAKSLDFKKLFQTAQTVVDNISTISTANAFNIPRHFEAENSDLFIQMMLHHYTQQIRSESLRMAQKVSIAQQVRIVFKYKSLLKNKSINKQNAIEMMFVDMREASLV